jgi:hypothetical protein
MNIRSSIVLTALIVALGSSSLASAQSINQRQRVQDQRIESAFDRGQLTRREADRLERRQRDVASLERRFRSDGFFSPRERRIVRDELNQLSRAINRLSSNRRGRR